jgi:hypothetical protein
VLFYRFLPMSSLLLIQVAYYAERSVDYTLVLAVLPFCAIAIPAVLRVTAATVAARWPVKLTALVPVAIGVWALAFTFVSLLRHDSPYSLLVQECRDLGRCSPDALMRGLGETIRTRAVLEHVRRPVVDGWLDHKGIVRDALALIDRWAPNEPELTVLLGKLQPNLHLTAGEIALMYSGKGDRWPRSFTFTDELVPPLAERIVAAPVRLRAGEIVLVRRDEATLGFIEGGILRRIRSETVLCPLPHPANEVIAYRVAGASGCASD